MLDTSMIIPKAPMAATNTTMATIVPTNIPMTLVEPMVAFNETMVAMDNAKVAKSIQ